eukprot:5068919-Amphidinium_carterae.1
MSKPHPHASSMPGSLPMVPDRFHNMLERLSVQVEQSGRTMQRSRTKEAIIALLAFLAPTVSGMGLLSQESHLAAWVRICLDKSTSACTPCTASSCPRMSDEAVTRLA